LMLRFR